MMFDRAAGLAVVPLAIALVWTVPARGASQDRETVTYTRDVAPIIFEHCAPCHRPGDVAPFSLLSYDDVQRRARQIVDVTARRYMPPWKPVAGYGGPFQTDRSLSDQQIRSVARWVELGTPEGNRADLPPAPPQRGAWHLGEPDLVITMAEPFDVRPEGPDLFRNFVIPILIDEAKFVAGLEFRPGNTRVAHHANLRIDQSPSSRELDDAEPGPGYEGPISPSAQYPDGHFLGWTPGQLPPLAPAGMAWRLEPGSHVVVQLHLQPSGRPERLQASVGLYFTDEPPVRTPMMLRLGEQSIDMAPDVSPYVIRDSYVLPVDVEVYAVQPHAHFRAREIKGFATLPDGARRWLLYIDDWDFNWQDVYRYAEPFMLPAGTTVAMEYTYDNSAANVRNPDRPPRRVLWGQNSTDEMGDLWIQVLPRSAADRETLFGDFRPKVLAEDAEGYETMLLAQPDDVGLHTDVAFIYWDLGQIAWAIEHYEAALRLDPDNPKTRYNYGTLLGQQGRYQAAAAQFQKSLELRPDHAETHNNLGAALRFLGRLDAALEHFAEAVRLNPTAAAAHNNWGYALAAAGRMDEAIAHFRQALAIDTGLGDAHHNLARALALKGELAEAATHHREALRIAPNWTAPMTDLAWLLATAPDAARVDPAQAVRLAERAVALTTRQNVAALDALAAAYAAAGRYDEAVATEGAAVELAVAAGAQQVVERLRERVELYRSRQRYVDRVTEQPRAPR